jgi:hypothetical protein
MDRTYVELHNSRRYSISDDPFNKPNKLHTMSESRDKRISEALRYRGLSVIIKSEAEFCHIKRFLGEDVLWMDFLPQMATRLTAIVIWSDLDGFGPGSVGCAESQKEDFIRLVEFEDFFKL